MSDRSDFCWIFFTESPTFAPSLDQVVEPIASLEVAAAVAVTVAATLGVRKITARK